MKLITLKKETLREIGYRETYDLEIDDSNHNFLIENGIISSNSHSYAYSLISYWEAHFKANYPVEYMKAILDTSGAGDDLMGNINVVKKMGAKILSPSINESERYFKIKDNSLLFSLIHIRNISDKDCDSIVNNRPYESFYDFYKRSELKNKAKFESLIFSGAFDEFGDEKEMYEQFSELRKLEKKELNKSDLKKLEFDNISINIKYQINDKLIAIRNKRQEKIYLPSEIDENTEFPCNVIAVLHDYKAKFTKTTKKPMGIGTIRDDNVIYEFMIWSHFMDDFSSIKLGSLIYLILNKFKDGNSIFLDKIVSYKEEV